ncbi:CCA tRNA nucleotidyltransferase [Halobacillus sp. A5]|uniref:CCA tRNA nucleotidyltransferase n=1 Tax=Halobacillus sp. A5 TaxID=2880263 RepID=UPI0020A66129|nr:CCA tRNA nucleotidyltransferase [Halobacillus sp. A5]
MNVKITKAFNIIDKIEKFGGTAYIVGGAVRDSLLGVTVEDVDIATSLTPEEMMKVFPKVIPVGIDHGTVLVRHASDSYEVTTYRTEAGYKDFRHPDEVTFVRSIEEDLARRDFTINAMALNKDLEIIDPFGGREDLNNHEVRAVGEAYKRFNEDPLRIMRALRFASQLGFNLHHDTQLAIKEQASLLSKISVERLAVEFEKMCEGKEYHYLLQLMKQLKVHIYLPVFKNAPNQIENIPKVKLNGFKELIPFYCEYASTFTVMDWVKDWKLSNQVKRNSLQLKSAVDSYKYKPIQSVLYDLPFNLIESFGNVLNALGLKVDPAEFKAVYEGLPIHSRRELNFQAFDLFHIFPLSQKGPWIGEYLYEIEHAVATGQIPNEKSAIKEWIKSWSRPETD